jgi:hypothetical protein
MQLIAQSPQPLGIAVLEKSAKQSLSHGKYFFIKP